MFNFNFKIIYIYILIIHCIPINNPLQLLSGGDPSIGWKK